ncbi:MAG: M48 family metalloprotease [Terriglobales bacterium]
MDVCKDPKRYAREKFWLGLASGSFNLVLLVLLLLTGFSIAIARWCSGPPALVVLEYVLLVGAGFQILDLPGAWLGRRIEIRFGMNRQGGASWLWDETKSTLLAAVLGIGAAELVYWLLRASPLHWWLWAWAAFAVVTVGLAQLGPVLLLPLFFKLRPMSADNETDAALVRRLESTYASLRAQNPKLPRLHGIFEWKLSEKSAKANAALTGLGRTRRVIISDTLLEGSPVEEIEAVFVHELGHHVHHDIWRVLAFQTGLSFLGFWLAQLILRALVTPLHLHGVADVAGAPLLLLVFSVLGLVLLPVSNAFVRVMERRADDYSFSTLGTAMPLLAGLRRLAEKNLAEVEPPRWKEWLLYSHPSIATRIRRGEAFESARKAARGELA